MPGHDMTKSYNNYVVGKSLEDCKQQLFLQYGSNYEIRNYTHVPIGGFLGMFQKTGVKAFYEVNNNYSNAAKTSSNNFESTKQQILNQSGINADALKSTILIEKRLDQMQKNIEEKMEVIAQNTNMAARHKSIEKIEDLLQENDFTLSYINSITSKMAEEFSIAELDDFDFVQKKVVDWIGYSIKLAPKIVHYRLPHVTVLVGPTGIGKTTTIAKFLSRMILDASHEQRPRPNIRLITIDRVRVGAIEQLARYAELLKVPIDKAEYVEDVKQLYEQYKNSVDEILIDTSGFSQNDYENIAVMRKILDVPNLNPDVYLCVDASTKASDIRKVVQNFEQFNYESVIVTKCDETEAYGNVISVLAEKGKKISYITDGQKVPNDFHRPSVVDFLIRLKGFSIDRVHIDDLFAEDK